MARQPADELTVAGLAFDSIDHHSPDGRLKDFDEVEQSAFATLTTLRRLTPDETAADDIQTLLGDLGGVPAAWRLGNSEGGR